MNRPLKSPGKRTCERILAAGVTLWREGGQSAASARGIGKAIGIRHSAVLYHYGNAAALQDAIAAEAVRVGDAVIVPMLIASKHPAAGSLSSDDRRRYLADC